MGYVGKPIVLVKMLILREKMRNTVCRKIIMTKLKPKIQYSKLYEVKNVINVTSICH